MTLSYNVGLTLGSMIGYVFDNMLGEQISDMNKICPVFPFAPARPTTTYVISTTTPTSGTLVSSILFANLTTSTTLSTTMTTSTTTMIPTSTLEILSTTSTQLLYESTALIDDNYTELILLSTSSPN